MPISGRAGVTRPRLLLVEDDASVRRSLQLLLDSRGYDVRAYGSGVGLQKDPEAMKAHCLVADLVLGEGDGFDLIRELKKAGWTGSAVLISGHSSPEVETRAIGEGYDLVLAKPLADAVLTGSIARLISNGQRDSHLPSAGTKD